MTDEESKIKRTGRQRGGTGRKGRRTRGTPLRSRHCVMRIITSIPPLHLSGQHGGRPEPENPKPKPEILAWS